MRTFIAITLTQEAKEFLAEVQSELKKSAADIKWVETKNIHLTLKFLGEIDQTQLQEIIRIIAEITQETNQFQVQLSSLGAFPSLRSPKVIWAGIEQGEKETKEIFLALENKLKQIGFEKEKRGFSSHITLGRVRTEKNLPKLIKALEFAGTSLGKNRHNFSVKNITLFLSRLSPQGPDYTVLKESALKTT